MSLFLGCKACGTYSDTHAEWCDYALEGVLDLFTPAELEDMWQLSKEADSR